MKTQLITTAQIIATTGINYYQLNFLILSRKLSVETKIAGRRLFHPSALTIINKWLLKQKERKNRATKKSESHVK